MRLSGPCCVDLLVEAVAEHRIGMSEESKETLDSVLNDVEATLLAGLRGRQTVPQATLVALSVLFPPNLLLQALEIVDRHCVTYLNCPSGRDFCKVRQWLVGLISTM